jgi:hypothetical protein
VGHFFCQERRSDGGIERALREGVNDMVNKQPLIRGHIWLIALGLVIAFAIYISAGGDLCDLRILWLAQAVSQGCADLRGSFDSHQSAAVGCALLV